MHRLGLGARSRSLASDSNVGNSPSSSRSDGASGWTPEKLKERESN